ncbi:MAG: GNAT family N-acetyltransferase [Telmatospirillum sp.]|nr:GNAT family N-acetyltransferase [Telmatospirillum sp.]
MDETIRTLELRALAAWPALETFAVDGWALRAANGYTKRANSANAIAPARASVDLQIARIEAHYRARTLPTIFRLSPLADPAIDRALEARGYAHIDPSLVMIARPGRHRHDPQAVDAADPWTGWFDAFVAATEAAPATAAKLTALLRCVAPPALFVRMPDAEKRPAAFAMAVAEDGYVGIFEVLSAAHARRQGFGHRTVAHAMAWGFARDAHTAYLQVAADNAPAIALYAALGFVPLYGYHYRVAP